MWSLWVGLVVTGVLAYVEYDEAEDIDVDFSDLEEAEDDPTTTVALATADTDGHPRLRRFGEQSAGARTLSLDEIRDVKGAIKELFAGRQLDHLTSPRTGHTTAVETLTKNPLFTGLTKIDIADSKSYDDFIEQILDHARKQDFVTNVQIKRRVYTQKGDVTPSRTKSRTKPRRTRSITRTTKMEDDPVRRYLYELYDDNEGSPPVFRANETTLSSTTPSGTTTPGTGPIGTTPTGTTPTGTTPTGTTPTGTTPTGTTPTGATPTGTTQTGTDTNTTVQATTTQTTKPTTTAGPLIDIPALVDIIANLTSDIESNITRLFNETLQKYNIPTCKTPTTPTTEKIFYDLVNATIVSKCFVCGLEDPGIPSNSHCADAFAGDFLPLVPVDAQARGHIARFRKYCRYMDINGVYENSTQPRSVYGRFTGGCSVRWVDLSGAYTQRACRNTRHAVTGRHFSSKRMAKLEMALNEVDNGCIISPMASLVPLSRGISLYARFHACVCTGNWCNVAPTQQWTTYIVILTALATAIAVT